MDLFSVSIEKVTLETYYLYFDFEKYFVNTDLLQKSEVFLIEDGGFSHEEMSFMLDNFKTSNFCCKGYPGRSFKPLNPISFELVQLGNAVWIDPEILENLATNSVVIRIEDIRLTSRDINQFIKKWLSEGTDWKFRDLALRNRKYTIYPTRYTLNPQKLSLKKILLGIKRSKGSKKNGDKW